MEVLWVSESNAFLEVFWGVLDVFWIFWRCLAFSDSVFGFLELLNVFCILVLFWFSGGGLGFMEVL